MRKDTFLLLEIINKELQVFLQTENLSKNDDECTISNRDKGVFLTVKGWTFNLLKNDDKCITRNRDDGFYLTINGWMFKVDTSKIHSLISLFAAKIPILKIHELGSDILESEFAKFINKYCLTLTEERFLLDVTFFTPKMTLKIIGLFKVGVIVPEDFALQSYIKKIEKFETFCKVCEIEVSWALGEYAGNSYRMRETTRKTETWMKKVYSDLRIIFKSAGINDIALVHKHLKEWPGKIQYDDCRNDIDNLIQEVIEEAEPNPINSIQWFWLQLLMESIRDTQCIRSSLSMNPVSLPLKFMRFPQFLCGCLICLTS